MVLAAVVVIPGYMVYFLIVKAKGSNIMEVNIVHRRLICFLSLDMS